jgi:hypothetical protein
MIWTVILLAGWLAMALWLWSLCIIADRADQERERLIRQFRATDHQRDVKGLRVVHWTTED